MEDIPPAIQSKLPSWQLNGGGGGVCVEVSQALQESFSNNWQNSPR